MNTNFIGLYLVRNGVISRAQLDEAIERQRQGNRRIGDLAVAKGLLSPDDVEQIFSAQHAAERPFGEIALELGLLGRDELDSLLFSQNIHNSHLGETLLEMGAITPEQLGPMLDAYHEGERSRAEKLRGSFDDDSCRHAASALITALTRAFLRFLGQEVKPGQGRFCGQDEPPGEVRVIHLGLPDGRAVEFVLSLPKPLASRLARGVSGLVHRGSQGALRGTDAFFAIVVRYARMISAQDGLHLSGCGSRLIPPESVEEGDASSNTFCLTTPDGALLTVSGCILGGGGAA